MAVEDHHQKKKQPGVKLKGQEDKVAEVVADSTLEAVAVCADVVWEDAR